MRYVEFIDKRLSWGCAILAVSSFCSSYNSQIYFVFQ